MKTTKLTSDERRSEMRRFIEAERCLRAYCEEECHSCQSDLLAHLNMHQVRSYVDSYNADLRAGLRGGDTKKKKKKKKKEKKEKKKGKKEKKVKLPNTIQDCPQYDEEMSCVLRYHKGNIKKCMNEEDVIGYGKSQLSDGQCYLHDEIRKRNPTYSSVTGEPYTKSDIAIIKSKMTEDEKIVVTAIVSKLMKQFYHQLKQWAYDAAQSAKNAAFTAYTASSAMKTLGGFTAAGVATFLSGKGAFAAVGAGLFGGLIANDYMRSLMIKKGISLVTWIVSSPKTALMFLFIVKRFMKAGCREAAKLFGRANYLKQTNFQGYMGSAKELMKTIAAGGTVSAGTITRAVTNGDTWKMIWKQGGNFAATAIAGAVPGGTFVKAGLGMVIGGMVDCAEEASRTGIELAAYQKDLSTGMQYIGDMLNMILNPEKCMLANGTIHFTSCGELSLDQRGCEAVPEHCVFIPASNPAVIKKMKAAGLDPDVLNHPDDPAPGGTTPAKDDERYKEYFLEGKTRMSECKERECKTYNELTCPKGRCLVNEQTALCEKKKSGWFSGGTTKDDIMAHEKLLGYRDIEARRTYNRQKRR